MFLYFGNIIYLRTYRTMSTNSYQFNNLYVMCSLNERAIYMKIVDKFIHTCYESNTDPKEIRGLHGTIADIYRLINKCLSDETVEFSVNNGIMTCRFNTCLEGFFTLKFDIMLREKILGQDGELSIQIFGLEQQLRESQEQIEKLEQRLKQQEEQKKETEQLMRVEIEKLQYNSDIAMRVHAGLSVDTDKISSEITIDGGNGIHKFVGFISNLKTLNINNYQVRGILNVGYNSMETIHINNSTPQHFDNRELLCLANKPNLKHIFIANCHGSLTMDGMRQFFNQMTCPLKTLTIHSCNQLTDKFAIQTLCDEKKVKLIM